MVFGLLTARGKIVVKQVYRQISNIRHNKFQNLNLSRLILLLSLPNPLKQGIKLRMKM